MVYIAHLSVSAFPSDGASVGGWVRIAVDELRRAKLKHQVHAMGTEIEYERPAQLWRLLDRIDGRLEKAGASRVMTHVKIDHRLDKVTSLRAKVRSALRPAPSVG